MSVTKMKHAVKINNGFYCSFLGQALRAVGGWLGLGYPVSAIPKG